MHVYTSYIYTPILIYAYTLSPHTIIHTLGATNRLDSIDKSFLRRMPFQMEVPLPNKQGRYDIFTKLLRHEQIDKDVDIYMLADYTQSYTGIVY